MSNEAGWTSKQAIALHEAVQELYTAIQQTKPMVGEQRSRPKAILRQLDAIQAHLDTIYTEASLQEIMLHDMTSIAYELRRAYDELSNDAETAYQDGWQAALKHVLENAPGDSGIVVGWLIHTLQADSAWQAPEWDSVIETIREARRMLTEGHNHLPS